MKKPEARASTKKGVAKFRRGARGGPEANMRGGYCIADYIEPDVVRRLALHPIIHIQFNERVFDLYVDVFGDAPAPWPLLPIELENLETALEFEARRIDPRSKGFGDWSRGIMLEYLKKSLSHGWPLDWHFVETALIPAKLGPGNVAGELEAIIGSGAGLSSRALELGVVVAQDLGWCGLRSPVEEFNWLIIFKQDRMATVSMFMERAASLGAEARFVNAETTELYI